MRIDIISCLPQMFESFLNNSVIQRGLEKGVIELGVHDLRNYSEDKHKKVDDYAFGGGAGMVLMIEPIAACIRALSAERDYDEIIYMSPDGDIFEQADANAYSLMKNIMIICGHYKGIDHRIREHFITREISIGDFVVSGGEIPAALIADAVFRLVPEVMSDATSALTDSFQDGLLAPPVYTRPAEFEGIKVPDVLLSGNHAAIDQWRYEKALERTEKLRPELFKKPAGKKA